MSEPDDKTSKAAPDPQPASGVHAAGDAAESRAAAEKLAGLMRDQTQHDADSEAWRVAAAAVAEGEKALADARRVLAEHESPPARSSTRLLVLRGLLAVNLVAMLVVALLPPAQRQVAADPTTSVAPALDPVPQAPPRGDLFSQALQAAEQHDYQGAIQLLERHLEQSPRLAPAQRANVLLALEHYATQAGDLDRARDYQRRTEALRDSGAQPEDLVAKARRAEQDGDVEAMRRHFARLLLQQRQIPSALHRHIAEAYLELGDSYRQQLDPAAAATRRRELEQIRQKLRLDAARGGGK